MYKKKEKLELFPLKWLSDIKINRYAKIKHDANPYDPDWKEYFEEREMRLMLNSAINKKTVRTLWDAQNRTCPYCHERIDSSTMWRVAKQTVNGVTKLLLVHYHCGRTNDLSNKLEEYEPVSI